MNFDLDVSYKQQQKLVMTQQMKISINILQGFDPVGIAAKDIKQCLKLQVKDLQFINEKERKHIYKIIDNYILDVAEGKLEELSSKMKIEEDEVKRYIDIIKKLEPKPSRGFYIGDEIKYIIPDAEIKKENGQYIVLMNDEILPKISINKELIESIVLKDKESASYIQKNIIKAEVLIKSIEERKKTLLRILEKILIKQESFFENGESYLKPMTIKEISEEVHLSESTVSRAIKDKYIKTNYGTFRIKDLKPIKITIKDIPEGKLIDYIIASAYLPCFKFEKIIDNSFYFDGGIYDNCPVDMFMDAGYDEIYVVKAWEGEKLKYKKKLGTKVVVISCREKLGSILSFSPRKAKRKINLGYYDTLRALDNLDGDKYYFKKYNENYYSSLFSSKDMAFMRKKYGNLFTSKSNKKFIISIIEQVCDEFKIQQFKVYNMPFLITKLKYKMVSNKNSKFYSFIDKIKVKFE